MLNNLLRNEIISDLRADH